MEWNKPRDERCSVFDIFVFQQDLLGACQEFERVGETLTKCRVSNEMHFSS